MADLTWPDDFINKVICGDCLEVMKGIPDGAVDLVVTSPPYNMRTRVRNGVYTTREWSEHFSKKYSHFHDALDVEEYFNFHKSALQEMLRVSRVVCWNIAIVTGNKWAVCKIIGEFSEQIKDVVVWDKGYAEPAMHDKVISRQTELILILEGNASHGRALSEAYFQRGTVNDLWTLGRGDNVDGHAATFPLSLPARCLSYFGRPNGIVLDPFTGTGTTLVAAKKMSREYIGIDIIPDYCKIAEQRLAQEELF